MNSPKAFGELKKLFCQQKSKLCDQKKNQFAFITPRISWTENMGVSGV